MSLKIFLVLFMNLSSEFVQLTNMQFSMVIAIKKILGIINFLKACTKDVTKTAVHDTFEWLQ